MAAPPQQFFTAAPPSKVPQFAHKLWDGDDPSADRATRSANLGISRSGRNKNWRDPHLWKSALHVHRASTLTSNAAMGVAWQTFFC